VQPITLGTKTAGISLRQYALIYVTPAVLSLNVEAAITVQGYADTTTHCGEQMAILAKCLGLRGGGGLSAPAALKPAQTRHIVSVTAKSTSQGWFCLGMPNQKNRLEDLPCPPVRCWAGDWD